MWYGTTVTNSEDMERIYQLPNLLNTFASIEPLLEDIDENISALKYLNWMQYIGDPDAFLLVYATNAPSIDEPSAGYIFTWDMLGNGQILPILNYLGENGTHTEYVEGLMATDMHKTSDDLARFYKSAV